MKKLFRKASMLLLIACMAVSMLSGCKGATDYGFDPAKHEYPVVTIEVEEYGNIVVELYPEIAPNTVANFVSLVESGFYDGLTFHRVIENFMIQGGCPKGDGTGDPGYKIKGEFTANGFENNLRHERGVISMARGGYSNDSAGCQFFIMHVNYPSLDGQYASFGKVVSGMDVVDAIAATKVGMQDRPVVEQKILSITVDTKGETYPEPKKLPDPYGRF